MKRHGIVLALCVSILPASGSSAERMGSIDAASLACAGAPENSCSGPPPPAKAQCLTAQPIRIVSHERITPSPRVIPVATVTTKRLPLKEQLSWVVSATWTEDESGLLLTDVPHSSLLWYDLNGQLIARINAAPGSAPALIARARGGGYIGNRQDQIAWFDKQLTPIKTRSIRGSKSSNYLDLVLG